MGATQSKSGPAPHVVIVGGNIAGIRAANEAEARGLRVTVIEPRSTFYVPFGGVRAAVVPGFERHLLAPYTKLFRKQGNQVIQGWATTVVASTSSSTSGGGLVTVQRVNAEGEHVSAPVDVKYDYLILAPGLTNTLPWSPPVSRALFIKQIGTVQAAIKSAAAAATTPSSPGVVVIGGGACGLELAGEVRDAYPSLPVTIVSSAPTLLAREVHMPARFKELLASEAAKANINIIASSRAEGLDALAKREGVQTVVPGVFAASAAGGSFELALSATSITSAAPASLKASVVILAVGGRPATKWLAGSSVAAAISTQGTIAVSRTYQVRGHSRIFAIGDAADPGVNEPKTALAAKDAAAVAVANIALLAAAGGPEASASTSLSLRQCPDRFKTLMLVPIGKHHGYAVVPGFCGPNVVQFLNWMKSGDYLAPRIISRDVHISAAEQAAFSKAL